MRRIKTTRPYRYVSIAVAAFAMLFDVTMGVLFLLIYAGVQ